MAKISRHGGASHDPWPLRGVEGVEVGERGSDVVDTPADARVQEGSDMQVPRGNASHAEWAGFVRHQNYPGDPEAAGRDELRDWWRGEHGGVDDDESEASGSAEDDGPPADAAAAVGGDAAEEARDAE